VGFLHRINFTTTTRTIGNGGHDSLQEKENNPSPTMLP
jgi:hypothetical protein